VTKHPEKTEYPAPFGNYIQLVPPGDIQTFLANQSDEMYKLLGNLSESDSLIRHAPYTWSIREVVGHITDCERVFGHRALWIARGATTPLASFDENAFMTAANFDQFPFEELLAEFECVRQSHLYFFKHLESSAWLRRGIVLDQSSTVRAFAYLIAGHTKHHLDILHRRLGR
jgi:uncharacterized damage-inducible protein DinB